MLTFDCRLSADLIFAERDARSADLLQFLEVCETQIQKYVHCIYIFHASEACIQTKITSITTLKALGLAAKLHRQARYLRSSCSQSNIGSRAPNS